MAKRSKRPAQKFGIGEWYGNSFVLLTPEQRKQFAEMQGTPESHKQRCPFQVSSIPEKTVYCNKIGGVCTLRLYTKDAQGGVTTSPPPRDRLRCTCPNRFKQDGAIYQWVAETLLKHRDPIILKEIPFLESTVPPEEGEGVEEPEAVGMIDNILVVPGSEPLRWCALEIQAVYFSGAAMSQDYKGILSHDTEGIPFPVGNRRPDYRSSAPKRLMPQLQIKVPSLRRWGKKMAVIVDQDFFRNMGPMLAVKDVSNCDVVWFVVKFDDSQGEAKIVPDAVYLTTLEHSVEGLTGGVPVSLDVFEQRINEKIT